jgi:hypothetical protein
MEKIGVTVHTWIRLFRPESWLFGGDLIVSDVYVLSVPTLTRLG